MDDNEEIRVSGDESDSSSISDCESITSSRTRRNASIGHNGLVRLDESDKLHGIVGGKFASRLSEIGIDVQIQCIRRNLFNTNAVTQARVGCFQISAKALEKKNGGDANIKYAWFGGSKDEIDKIVLHGFGFDDMKKKNGFDVHGIVLSPDHSPFESVESSIADEDGIKHILLCRVLLGKTELVNSASTQSHPTSEDFQSGVDDLVNPKKYIVWSSHMNTHILPEFIISFKNNEVRRKKPVSPWIPIPNLIATLSKILPPKSMNRITQYRQNYIEHKISRQDMIRGIRGITGDSLLITVLKNFNKERQRHRLVV